MGRKDSINRGSNLDNYRKRIGKQELQRNKGNVKSLQDVAEAKQSALSVKDVLLVLLAIFLLISSLYLMFVYSFSD